MSFWLACGFSLIFAGGVVLEATVDWLNHSDLQWLWNLEIIAEESLEMLGSVAIALSLVKIRDALELRGDEPRPDDLRRPVPAAGGRSRPGP